MGDPPISISKAAPRAGSTVNKTKQNDQISSLSKFASMVGKKTSTMVYGRGGKQKKPAYQPSKKKARVEKDSHIERQDWVGCNKAANLAEREAFGLIPVTQKQFRAYITIAFVIRFEEPIKEDWPGIATLIAGEIHYDKRSVLEVFRKVTKS